MPNSKVRLSLILLLALPLAAQTDSGKSASAEGTVTDSVSGLPIPRAHVTLQDSGKGKPVQYGTTSSADGKFSFSGLAPGAYVAEGERTGFVRALGPRNQVRFELQSGDRKTDIGIRLTPTGSITGRVTDSDGEPVENVYVSADNGRGSGAGVTDEKGRFRIGGLGPGNYTVKINHNDFFGGTPEIRTDGTKEVHNAATYYPGVLSQKEAMKVSVRPASETTGIDIRMMAIPFIRVSGRVLDLPHDTHPQLMISQGDGATGTDMNPNGSFVLWRLDPGKYMLSAEWEAPNGDQVHTAGVEIEVAEANIDNIELRVVPDSDISGQLEFEDDDAKQIPHTNGPEQDVQERRIGLESSFHEGGGSSTIDSNGAFQLKKVPAGKYQVGVSWGNSYVKSMRLGSTIIVGHTLDLSAGSGGSDLSILMSAANGSIAGAVHDDSGQYSGLTVVLTDADPDTNDYNTRYAGVGADGSYTFDHIAPGSYRIVVVPDSDVTVQGNAVIGYEDLMESVEVGPKEKVTKDLERRKPDPQ